MQQTHETIIWQYGLHVFILYTILLPVPTYVMRFQNIIYSLNYIKYLCVCVRVQCVYKNSQ